MKISLVIFLFCSLFFLNTSCDKNNPDTNSSDILGFSLLEKVNGHWIGTNETAFGFFDWFSFDFRPISASHVHSIYEGGTNQNIITSFFVADFEGKQQIMARNGGWLGPQYRATYFVLDQANETDAKSTYRLVDAVGREKRAFMELTFERDSFIFKAYKDGSGALDEPVLHMEFRGKNLNPAFAKNATENFDFPKPVSEVDLNGKFTSLLDNDSALFLEKSNDPFPKENHGHLSDLKINITRAASIESDRLRLYISSEPIVDASGTADFDALNTKVIRTIDVAPDEDFYLTTYLHPDNYYLTAFSDKDNNFFPSTGDFTSVSQLVEVASERLQETSIDVSLEIK